MGCCLVCGHKNGRKCYGSIACNACKIFFLRSTAKNMSFVCPKDGKCIFPKDECRACRYQQCLNAGLIPNIVARREGCTLRRQASPSASPVSGASTSAASASPPPQDISVRDEYDGIFSSQFFDMGVTRFDCAPQCFADPQEEPVKALLQLEAFCNADDSPSQSGPLTYNLELHFADLLQNPTLVCPRVPIGFKNAVVQCEPMTNLGPVFARILLHVVDWLRGLPEISLMDAKDQVTFCRRQFLSMSPFVMLAYTYKMNNPGLLIGLHQCLTYENSRCGDVEMTDFGAQMIAAGQEKIIKCFRETKIDDGDYVLLKNCLVFHSAHGLSAESAEMVRDARRKYEAILVQRLRAKSASEQEAFAKMERLLDVLKSVVELGYKRAPVFARCVTFNICGLKGSLPIEVYILS